jgi:hypothetical protein
MGSILTAIGGMLVIVAVLFDLFIRLRMRLRAGYKHAFTRGVPTWDIYSKYRSAAARNGWASWPVTAMQVFLALGMAVIVIGIIAIHANK